MKTKINIEWYGLINKLRTASKLASVRLFILFQNVGWESVEQIQRIHTFKESELNISEWYKQQ